tara:strand:+ start:1294 stop:1551 length:258 start_codon:yes stop_codon:yes gene_type:complete
MLVEVKRFTIFVPTKTKKLEIMKNPIFAIQDSAGNFFIKNHNLSGFSIPKFGNDHTIKIWNDKQSAIDFSKDFKVPVDVVQIIKK